MKNINEFRTELESLINRYSIENDSNTPDYILAEYLVNCLLSFNLAVNDRTNWFRPDSENYKGKTNNLCFFDDKTRVD